MAQPETRNYMVAIGASAGGLKAISDLLSEMPEAVDAPIVVAMHSAPKSSLAEILQMRFALPIKQAEDGEVLQKGTIYILPPATHGMFSGGKLRLSPLVEDSGFRPSIDALLMTMAAEYGEDSIAVILSGTLKDGMRGAQVIYDMGGQTIVQSPKDADQAEMPRSVIASDHPEVVLTAGDLGTWLVNLIGVKDPV